MEPKVTAACWQEHCCDSHKYLCNKLLWWNTAAFATKCYKNPPIQTATPVCLSVCLQVTIPSISLYEIRYCEEFTVICQAIKVLLQIIKLTANWHAIYVRNSLNMYRSHWDRGNSEAPFCIRWHSLCFPPHRYWDNSEAPFCVQWHSLCFPPHCCWHKDRDWVSSMADGSQLEQNFRRLAPPFCCWLEETKFNSNWR